MKLTSSVFVDGGEIPLVYTCEGDNVSPPLSISEVPAGTQALALIVHDPDVPKQVKPDGIFDHWVMFNITPTTTQIAQSETPGIEGNNGAGTLGYRGPCPPKEYQPSRHRYIFTLYALTTELPLAQGASKEDVLEAMEGNIIAQTELIGTYEKQ
ncbi:YbhB/YbcL family Raf kinase inhibitor-like protein [Acetobacteraceae bacterium]|nr:YbhB/YbcL family Raf kinase inhibitor-like protein [Candidatus Parcubacteria bacterium]